MDTKRRRFLKVIAASPLVACAGSSGEPGSLEGDDNGYGSGGGQGSGSSAGTSAGTGSAGSSAASAGRSTGGSAAGGSGSSSAGTSASAGNAFSSSGNASGGYNFGSAGTANTGSSGMATGGTGNSMAGTNAGPPPKGDMVGNVSEFPVGTFTIAAHLYALGHDAQGIYAMSLQCTHQGCACDLTSGNQLLCPCHKSRFDQNGSVLQGPAGKPLPHYTVAIDGSGNIYVDKYSPVDASTRTPV